MPPSRTAERLGRLLALVPHVLRNPGVSLADLSKLFGASEEDITRDLNLLVLTGLPPYSPGDLIEVDITDGQVSIRMADHFSRPVRLTRSEALSLFLRGTELLGSPGLAEADVLRSALDKLEKGLGAETLGELKAAAGEGGPTGPLAKIRDAIDGRERIEIDHYSAARDELVTRRIDPEQVFFALGNWYAVAWDHLTDEERMFRVDRIREVRATGEKFEPRGLLGQGRPLYSGSPDDVEVRLLLRPPARWVAEYYETTSRQERGDDLEVSLPTKDLAWVAKLVLRLGGEAEVLAPETLHEAVRDVAARTSARYAS